jgi:two-component system chemotaxis response regulator CheB
MINPEYNIVGLTASSGGLKALSEILSNLPKNFPAPIVVVQHLSPNHRSRMAEILNKRTCLYVKQAQAGEILYPGTVYIAPPNLHLLISIDETVYLSNSEKVCFVRPSGDVLFKSIAASFQERAIAIVLTGMHRDGAAGVEAIKVAGGRVIAQDEASSEFFGMPGAAIKTGVVDSILPLAAIAPMLLNLVQ